MDVCTETHRRTRRSCTHASAHSRALGAACLHSRSTRCAIMIKVLVAPSLHRMRSVSSHRLSQMTRACSAHVWNSGVPCWPAATRGTVTWTGLRVTLAASAPGLGVQCLTSGRAFQSENDGRAARPGLKGLAVPAVNYICGRCRSATMPSSSAAVRCGRGSFSTVTERHGEIVHRRAI